jgi:hypothetical protein
MKKNLGTFFGLPHWGVGAVLLALCAFTPVSRADVYILTYNDGGFNNGSGQINVVGGLAQSGSTFTVTVPTSSAFGTWTLVGGGGSGSAGGFAFDNVVNVGSNPFLTAAGLVFSLGVNDINLYANGPGSYTLLGNIGGVSFDPQTTGTATLTPVPEPISYALAVFGLIFVGGSASRFYLGRRRSAMAS